jgi:hypothetical protein
MRSKEESRPKGGFTILHPLLGFFFGGCKKTDEHEVVRAGYRGDLECGLGLPKRDGTG